jgi:NADH-quinone oxidoreductase subunit E
MAASLPAPPELQPASFAFTAENEAWAKGQIAKYPPGRQMSAVIPLLWRAQEQAGGWLPQKAIEAVAERLEMPFIRVMEVVTFYSMFNLQPVGRYFVQLCGTVPCHVKGAIELKEVLRRRFGEQRHVSDDGKFSWLEVECLGACCNAPMAQINDDYYEDLTPDSLGKLLDDLAAGRPVKAGPQNGRRSSEPFEDVKTLTDATLFDGSVVGAWRKRFEEVAVAAAPSDQAAAVEAKAATDPKLGRGDNAGRATELPVSDAPAQRAAAGEAPVSAAGRRDAAAPDRATTVAPRTDEAPKGTPQSEKSYTPTPSKAAEGRPVADDKGSTPVSGTPVSDASARRDGSDSKPDVRVDKSPSPDSTGKA